jgi:hypothetical protein
MDETTRKALDSLIGGKAKRRDTTTPPSPFISDIERMRRESERLARTMYTHATPPITPTVTPTFCYSNTERELDLKQATATLSVDAASASIILKAPLNDLAIQRINSAVPLTQREWLPDKRAWRFSPAALPMLKPILKDIYKDIQMLGVPKALPATKFDQLIAKLTAEDKVQVYRLLAAKYHPDKGGSHEIMTLINIVFRG